MPTFKVTLAQKAPVYLDLAASLERLHAMMAEAAAANSQLLVLGESWLSGYPAFLDYVPGAAIWDAPETKAVYAQMVANAWQLGGPADARIQALCQQHQLALCIGANERIADGPGHGSLYNALLIYDKTGKLQVHHRKLVPTYTERMVHAQGDAQGLHPAKIDNVNVGGLICWEHWMPLSRQVLHDAGEAVHVALWPTVHERHQIASRHYAFEGRCYVLAIGQLLAANELPSQLKLPDDTKPDALLMRGGSAIIGPDGHYILEPRFDESFIETIELDLEALKHEQMTLDVSGHYARPDVFRYHVNRHRGGMQQDELAE